MGLINADELWKYKFKSASEKMDLDVVYMGGWNDAIDSIVENAPIVDGVPVVRCKDCIHNSLNRKSGNAYCDFGFGLYQLDDFCSRGERREE